MKKLYKILLLTLIIALTVCVRSYATVDDNLQNSEPNTDLTENEETDTSTGSDGTEEEIPSTTPDDEEEDSSSTPGGNEEEDPSTTPGENEDDDTPTTPGGNEDDNTSTTPGNNEEENPSTTPGEDEGTDNEAIYTTQDTTTNIKLSANIGVVPDGTTLEVEAITSGDVFDAISEKLGDAKFSLFDISLMSNNTAIQPTNGTVKIGIPIPSGYNTSNLVVYRFADDGSQEQEYAVTVDGNYAVFETDHFSNYALAEKSATTNTSTSDNQLDNEPKTGIANPITLVVSTLAIACLGLFVCIKKLSK